MVRSRETMYFVSSCFLGRLLSYVHSDGRQDHFYELMDGRQGHTRVVELTERTWHEPIAFGFAQTT